MIHGQMPALEASYMFTFFSSEESKNAVQDTGFVVEDVVNEYTNDNPGNKVR